VRSQGIGATERTTTGLVAGRVAHLESTNMIDGHTTRHGPVNSSKIAGVPCRMKTAGRKMAAVWSRAIDVTKRTATGLVAGRVAHLESTKMIGRRTTHHGPVNSLGPGSEIPISGSLKKKLLSSLEA